MKKRIPLLISIGFLGSVLVVGSSLAWLTRSAAINGPDGGKLPIESGTESGYFAYGNGLTKNTAYGIKTPRQLYNLAWLQYLGLLDLDSKQLYFELADNIDMTGWVLPPIGTETYPFISYFDGQGYVISNLTVSNNFSEYNTHPSVISAWDNSETSKKKQPHILGLFGVIGNYDGHLPVLPVTPAQPEEGIDYYDASKNAFVNTGIVDATITSVVAESLIGIAAGYADASMSQIAVESGAIDIDKTIVTAETASYGSFTNNISDYTLVGYTPNKKSIKKVSNTIYDISVSTKQEFIASTQGSTTGWGGSIDMNSVFNRLTTMRTSPNYTTLDGDDEPFSIHYKHLDDSDLDSPYDAEITSYQTIRRYTGNTGTNTNGVVNFVRDGNSWSSRKHYLVGGKYITRDVYTSNDSTNGYQIKDNNGHYLAFDGTSLTNSNSAYTNGWEFETVNGNGYIRTNQNGAYYYLRNNAGSLETTTVANQATSWKIEFENTNLSISSTTAGVTRNILYDNGWGLFLGNQLTNIDKTRYIPSSIRNNTDNTGLASVTSPEVAFGSFENGDQVYFTYNGTTYYLCVNLGSGNSYYVGTRATAGDGTNYYALCYYNVDGYVYVRTATSHRIGGSNNRYAFLRINSSNNWLMTTHGSTTNDDSRLAFGSTGGGLLNTLTTKSSTLSSEKMEFTTEDTTYFPIMVNSDNSASNDNIGYFVAGSTSSTFEEGGTSPRSIIVSNYPKDRVLKGYSNKKFTDSEIYTINSSGPGALNYSDKEKYAKYSSSKTNLENILSQVVNNQEVADVGGFHFYARDSRLGSISKQSTVMAKNVLITDGDKDTNDLKTTFELPVYSLDFHLTEQGRINFFAGMYNGGYSTSGTKTYGTTVENNGTKHMNGFFSFHKVIRNGDEEITSIREVKCIYEKEGVKNYTYTYKEGSTIVDEGGNVIENINAYVTDNNLTLLFDTDWLGYRELHTDPGRVYYFEIPADEGEYCLGSYETPEGVIADGAYLMYLDIGAGAAKTKRTAVAEHFLETSITTSYPLGVALISSDSASSDSNSFDSSNSVIFVIEATYKGSFTIARDENDNVIVEREADYTEVAKPTYISEEIVSVVDPGATSASTDDTVFEREDAYESKLEKETYRIQYFDYNVNRAILVTTTIEDTKSRSNEGEWSAITRRIVQQEQGKDAVVLENQGQIDSCVILVFKYLGVNSNVNGISWTYDELMSQTTNLWYYATSSTEGETTTVTEHLTTLAAICATLSDPLVALYHQTDINVANPSASVDISQFNVILNMKVDESISDEVAKYYMFDSYQITPIAVNGSVIYIVEDLATGAVVYVGAGTTAVAKNDEVTINP